MGFGLVQEQSQRLVMTMQMKQAIEVLQCSAAELHEYIENQIADNPFAEMIPTSPGTLYVWDQGRKKSGKRSRGERSQLGLPLEQLVRNEPSLTEALERQLGLYKMPLHVLEAAQYIVGCLNESGYLIENDEQLVEILELPLPVIEQAVQLVQSLEPCGIGARNLKQCLILQLEYVSERIQPVVRALVEHHLEDIAYGRMPSIAKQLKVPVQLIQEGVDALRKLNPRPGLCYRTGQPEYVIPDVIVERVGQNYLVRMNEYGTPSVQLCSANRRLLMGQGGEEAKEFVQKRLHSAEWIVKCIEQRRLTLYRVAEALVEFQQAFFDYGRAHMKPLTLRQVADYLGLHESTISRATRGKYMQTPRGVYEMRYFFTSELHSTSGTTSAEAAKHGMKQLIDKEDATSPLSDDVISQKLMEAGIHISRRTVAKYREEMGIPTSARRRRFA